MSEKNKSSKLFSDFPEISSSAWKDKVISDLKGADFDRRLVWKTENGFNVLPYYLQEDSDKLEHIKSRPAEFPYVRGKKSEDNNWKIRQDIQVTDQAAESNQRAINAIEKGADSIGFVLSGNVDLDVNGLSELLKGISLTDTEIHFKGEGTSAGLYKLLIDFSEKNALDISGIRGSLDIDPIGELTLKGEIEEAAFAEMADIITIAMHKTPQFKIIGVKANIFQDGGSSLTQELAYGLSVANEYLDKLTSNGLTATEVMKSMQFTFAVGPNYFMEIAKPRAARWLWSVICKEWGIETENINMALHSETVKWNLSLYDPYVNVLRGTTEAMSASLGSTDSISVQAFDKAFRDENDFSSRISRNLQIILKEEAYFDKVADPAAGSYYIETLTDNIAEQAWALFKELENDGGYLEAFQKGMIQEQIAQSLSTKKERAASRKDSILGVNQYPNFNEMVLDQYSPESENGSEKKTSFSPIGQYRIAEDFENLRLQTEKNGKRPKVFLLKYGDPGWMTARAMFAGNFFAVAGYEIIDSSGFDTIEKGIKAASAAKSDIVVLCSSDAEYANIGPIVSEAMKDTSEIVIAGYPKECREELQRIGINHFIHVKTNILEKLKEFNTIMEIG
jgi:methylmalonyl-CoA mutase